MSLRPNSTTIPFGGRTRRILAAALIAAAGTAGPLSGGAQAATFSGWPQYYQPDLVVSELVAWGTNAHVTVKNRGKATAGASRLTVKIGITTWVFSVGSLAPLGTQRFALPSTCREVDFVATADAANQVSESNEGNNRRTEYVIC